MYFLSVAPLVKLTVLRTCLVITF